MAIRTVTSFVAYQVDGAGEGVPLVARGAPGTVYLAAPDSTRTTIVVQALRRADKAPITVSSNVHAIVDGFLVDVPVDRPGIWFVSGNVASYQMFEEGRKGDPGLPGSNTVPADEAVAAYLAAEGTNANTEAKQVTRTVLAAELDTRSAAVLLAGGETRAAVDGVASERMASAVDPLAYLDNIEVMCSFSMYKDDGVTADRGYVQGLSINEADDELYLNYGGGTAGWQRFEVRRLSTGAKISERKVSSENSYGQGMPWFRNGSGKLCFIGFLKAKNPDNTGYYQIYNYDDDTVGASIPIASSAHGDRSGDYFVTSDVGGVAPNTVMTRFYLYTWESIKAGAPVLVRTVPISNPGITPAKYQGETMNGSHIFTHGGNPSVNGGLPTIGVYDFTGQLVGIRQYPVAGLVEAINEHTPGTLVVRSNLDWEAEGITNENGRLYTQHVFGNAAEQTHDPFGGFIRTVVILRHNNPVGVRMSTKPVETYARDTDWVNLGLVSPFTGTLQYRVKDGMVFVRALLVGSFPEGATAINSGLMPEEWRPKVVNARGVVYFNGNYVGGCYQTTAGTIGVNHVTGAARANAQFIMSYPIG